MKETLSDFDRAFVFIWRRKLVLSALLAVGALAGFGGSYCITPLYQADAILIPSEEMLGLNVNASVGSLGGLASIVGVGGGGYRDSEAIETLRSRALTTSYIESQDLLPVLFKSRWDPVAKKWKPQWFGHDPTLDDGYRTFDKKLRSIVENRKTGLTTISITWSDPVLAKQWVEGLVDAANDRLRLQAIERSTRNLEYLRKASEATNVMEVKTAIYKLMETEIKKQMVAYGGKDYAFRVVDAPVVPERKILPVRSTFVVGGAILLPIAWLLFLAWKRLLERVT